MLATATVSGPLIGGLLVDTAWLGWRWCFYVGVPIGVVALIVLQRTLNVPTVKREVKLDHLGAALIAGGVSTLLTLPLVGGLMMASTVSGQLISRYGRWKGFLVTGAILTTTGLTLLSTMDHTTSIPQLGLYLAVLGLGVGMSTQNLVLAVQNSVDMTEIGSASSLVAFLRSMGGTVGVTVLGIVLSHRVSALLGVPASSTSSGTSDLSQLDAAAAAAVRAAYGDAIGRVFLIAAIGSILTLVAVAFIKEVPLRTTVGSEPAADAPSDAPSGVAEPDPAAPAVARRVTREATTG